MKSISALTLTIGKWDSYVIIKKYLKQFCKSNVFLKRYDQNCVKPINFYRYADCYIYDKSSQHDKSIRKCWSEDSLTILEYNCDPWFIANIGKSINPLIHGGNKRLHILKQTCSCRKVLVCVSFLLPPGMKGLTSKHAMIHFYLFKMIFLQHSVCATMKVALPLLFIMSFISCSQVYEHSVCLRSLMIIYAYLKSQLKYLELH